MMAECYLILALIGMFIVTSVSTEPIPWTSLVESAPGNGDENVKCYNQNFEDKDIIILADGTSKYPARGYGLLIEIILNPCYFNSNLKFFKARCAKCAKNEVYDICPAPCPPRRCDVDERVIRCAAPPKPGDPECKPGCRCADNYYRNKHNVCVPKNECSVQCNKNEIYDKCPPKCPPQECGIDPAVILCLPNPQPGDPECEPGCRCIDDYYRNVSGDCIPKEQCPTCGANEVYDICPAPCPPRRCDVDERLIKCAAPPKPGDPECEPGCRCADDYYRNDQNICVPKNECPVRCNKNEIFDICPPKCPPQECGIDPAVILCLPNPQPGDPECEPGCRCIDDYYRDVSGDCIPKEQCPTCGTNEVYDICPAPCPPRRCDVDERLIRCAAPPKPGDPECEPGCRCADDYYRNDQNICIPKSECPPKPNITCGPDEVYTTCVNGGCGRWNCSQTGIKCIKLKEGACREGCHCKENYLRTDDGTCVPADKCPQKCAVNEVYDICSAPCPPRRCDVDERIIRCAAPPVPGDPECEPGCRCADNYYRNDQNVCVLKNECPKNCTENEEYYYECAPTCPPEECGTDPAVILCAPNPQLGDPDCAPGCRCIDGYQRNDFGDCVPKYLCP